MSVSALAARIEGSLKIGVRLTGLVLRLFLVCVCVCERWIKSLIQQPEAGSSDWLLFIWRCKVQGGGSCKKNQIKIHNFAAVLCFFISE